FEYIPVAGSSTVNQFYIGAATVAPVPVPAAGLLLLTALGGLGVARRRRKAA
ncbi:MAG: VPLPA-CTERM sorting domain-containing protein, partial [Sedimentitalea sp.]|nr:VPLPA-CTERM sorting domain-containing protein [Sedimentitalea sp.]